MMQRDAKPTKAKKTTDPVKCRELPKGHSQRKAGYLWIVESRLGGTRTRKFFRHDQSAERDQFMADLEARADALGRLDRGIVNDEALLSAAAAAHKLLVPYGRTIGDAVAYYLDHLKAEAKRDATPVSAIVRRFLDEKERDGVSETHLADLTNRIARFEETFGKTPIAAIKRNHVADWLSGLELSPQSRLNFRRVLSNLFAYAVRVEVIEINPVVATSKPTIRRKRIVVLSPEEVSRVLAASSPEILPAQILMVFCGIRNAELFRLDWSNVDWEDATIAVYPEEGKREGHARHVSIPENAQEWLRPFAKRRGKIADFRDFDEYTRRLQGARAAAGWDVGEWPGNALRKTFISSHLASHGSVDDTARQAGTSAAMIRQHYHKLTKKRVADRLWTIRPESGESVVKFG